MQVAGQMVSPELIEKKAAICMVLLIVASTALLYAFENHISGSSAGRFLLLLFYGLPSYLETVIRGTYSARSDIAILIHGMSTTVLIIAAFVPSRVGFRSAVFLFAILAYAGAAIWLARDIAAYLDCPSGINSIICVMRQ